MPRSTASETMLAAYERLLSMTTMPAKPMMESCSPVLPSWRLGMGAAWLAGSAFARGSSILVEPSNPAAAEVFKNSRRSMASLSSDEVRLTLIIDLSRIQEQIPLRALRNSLRALRKFSAHSAVKIFEKALNRKDRRVMPAEVAEKNFLARVPASRASCLVCPKFDVISHTRACHARQLQWPRFNEGTK